MPSLDSKLGLAVGGYVGLLAAVATAPRTEAVGLGPVAWAVGLGVLLAVGGVFALRPGIAEPVVKNHVHSLALGAHVLAVPTLFVLHGADEAAVEHPLTWPFLGSIFVGAAAFAMVRDRHVAAVFGGEPARVSWYGGMHPRTIRRKRAVAVGAVLAAVVTSVLLLGVVPERFAWLESTRGWSLLVEFGPGLVGGVFGAAIGTFVAPDQQQRLTIYDDGVVLQGDRLGLRTRMYWRYVRGYELTDRELVVHTWFPLQSYRFDRAHFEQPERVADILDDYVPEVDRTWL